MYHYHNIILDHIKSKNPIHFKKINNFFNSSDTLFFKKSNQFYQSYENFLIKNGMDFNQSIDYYLKMISDMNEETFMFHKTGEYTSSSFEEVNKRVYNNPDVMNYYLHGLIISQFLWKQHYGSYLFYINTLKKLDINPKNYLEIGVGHGLLLSESMEFFDAKTTFDALDISGVSIEFAKNFIGNKNINYYCSDIFNFSPITKYDFISMGEVLEHVENPKKLLIKVKSLLNKNGILFITTPTNAPTIDHIYLFRNINEIRNLLNESGFKIIFEDTIPTENLPKEKIEKYKISEHYSSFLKINHEKKRNI